MADIVDFSSFSKEEEKGFVPFEKAMRDNEKRANTLGFSIAGGVFALAALIVLVLYTPCSNFCERPPGGCKSESEIAAFKTNCQSSCRALEHESGLSIIRATKDETTGKSTETTEDVSGTTFVQTLSACAFGGGGGTTCEGVTKVAASHGLWCLEKK